MTRYRSVAAISLLLVVFVATACRPLSWPDGAVPPDGQDLDAIPGSQVPAALVITPTPISLSGPLTVSVAPNVPERYATPISAILAQAGEIVARNGPQPLSVAEEGADVTTGIELAPLAISLHRLLERYFAVVAPFAVTREDITLDELRRRWSDADPGPLLITPEAGRFLPALLGPGRYTTVEQEQLLQALTANPDALGLVAFDRIDPTLKVLTVDGINVLDNRLMPGAYPLAVGLHVTGSGAPLVAALLRPVVTAISPYTNRDADRLTHLVMTGVTAMSRATAARMEQEGYLFPALIISDTLAAADITHVSNEVPFLDDCQVNNTVDNLVLCSHTDYWAALAAIGTDVVGLSGNHVNDFGRDGALRSLAFYQDNEIPVYGSGLNTEEACAPLLWSDHGNTFAFLAVLAFGPSEAWATESLPGACYYYDNKDQILATVRELSEQVDIVAVELQHVEIYDPAPTPAQVAEFRELLGAGADIVTGVQSHVPQAVEPYGNGAPPAMILYGLGNFFFDQMWSWETRTELIARHVIYQGRLLNTELLTTVLEHYAQPRWATPEERQEILSRIFAAAPARE